MTMGMKTGALVATIMLLLAVGCRSGEKPRRYSVGVAVDTVSNHFNSSWIRHLEEHPHVVNGLVKLRYYVGHGDIATQRKQFHGALYDNHDALIVVADDLTLKTRLLEKAAEMGTPVIASLGHTDAGRADSFIGPDDEAAGYLAARALFTHMGGQGRVVVLNGPLEQGAALHRDRGLDRALEEFPRITIVGARNANWSMDEAERVVRNWLAWEGKPFDAIFAQNDEMALGAVAALKHGKKAMVPVVGIDGIDEALRAVRDGEMLLTLRQDAQIESQGALDLALRRVIGPEYIPMSGRWGGGAPDWANGTG